MGTMGGVSVGFVGMMEKLQKLSFNVSEGRFTSGGFGSSVNFDGGARESGLTWGKIGDQEGGGGGVPRISLPLPPILSLIVGPRFIPEEGQWEGGR